MSKITKHCTFCSYLHYNAHTGIWYCEREKCIFEEGEQ